jgi:hypothetical protein
MYYKMINSNLAFASGLTTILGGLSADELTVFNQGTAAYVQFQKNDILSDNPFINSSLWSNAYSVIYIANSIIEGLENNTGVHESVRNELIGESKFIRAFCNFYLVNLFGDIPLVNTINYRNTSLLSRSSKADVFKAIISDLQDAQNRLPEDFSAGMDQRIVPNKFAATAMLARVHLYNENWIDAETQSSSIIENTGLFSLVIDLKKVFLANSTESIWQLQQNNTGAIVSYNATPEGYQFIPSDSTFPPFVYLTSQLLDAFDSNDQRKISWTDTVIYGGEKYYYPFKYKVGIPTAQLNGPYTEYYSVLRLSEQYLIRAEARAHLNKIDEAKNDLNTIRNRAGLFNTDATDQVSLLSDITRERQLELFCEWGHRWMDLKRMRLADAALQPFKSGWTTNDQLYPIPISELIIDPNLTQNPAYN